MGRAITTQQYNQKLAEDICEGLCRGRSLRTLAKDLGFSYSNCMRWLNQDATFAEQYARAREIQADYFVDEILEIADEPPQITQNGAVDSAWVARQNMRIQARKWLASKLRPKKYADRTDTKLDTEAPLTIEIVKFSDER